MDACKGKRERWKEEVNVDRGYKIEKVVKFYFEGWWEVIVVGVFIFFGFWCGRFFIGIKCFFMYCKMRVKDLNFSISLLEVFIFTLCFLGFKELFTYWVFFLEVLFIGIVIFRIGIDIIVVNDCYF